jgi:hypothetical protein
MPVILVYLERPILSFSHFSANYTPVPGFLEVSLNFIMSLSVYEITSVLFFVYIVIK